jgi:hypothetical protein
VYGLQTTPANTCAQLTLKEHLVRVYSQGLIIIIAIVLFQLGLSSVRGSFTNYMPPIGFVFYLLFSYFIQPMIIGVLNIIVIHWCTNCRGWQVNFWLNGLFLVLAFSTLNFLLQLVFNLSFTIAAVIDIAVFAFPFGCLARYSNGGWNKPID